MTDLGPFSGHKRNRMSSTQRMMGKFINSPQPREYTGYDWRTASPAYKKHQKRALAQFRRRDGKRFVMEGLALIAETEAMLAAEEAERIRQEYLDDSYYDPDYEYGNDDYYDGVDYGDERGQSYDYQGSYFWDDMDCTADVMRSAEENFDAGYKLGLQEGRRRSYLNRHIS